MSMGKTAKLAPLVTLVTTESRGRAVRLALLVRQGHRAPLERRALKGSQELLDQPAPLEQRAK